jgi:Spy/CpxP family protein refolding chaperone
MRQTVPILLAAACTVAMLAVATAQPPEESKKAKAKDYSHAPIVVRMMAFDKNKDGKLTKDEITDSRLLRLFDRADANKDGVVTKEELMALAAQLEAESGQERGFGGPGGPGGFGPPGGPPPDGPGGFGPPGGPGRGGFGGPPRPGQILPPFMQERLNLTDNQKKQLEELQKEVDSRLGKILTSEQKQQLQEMRGGFGRGGFGGRGGRGPGGPGRGGPGGPPDGRRPGGDDRPPE